MQEHTKVTNVAIMTQAEGEVIIAISNRGCSIIVYFLDFNFKIHLE